MSAGGKAAADTGQLGELQDVEDEESSDEEDSEDMPCEANDWQFAPDIVARFEEGYRNNDIAAKDAMRRTYVSPATHRMPEALLVRSTSTCAVSTPHEPLHLASAPHHQTCLITQEWRRKIDGFNMLEQPQQHFELFKVSARPTALTSHALQLHLLVRLASLPLQISEQLLRRTARRASLTMA